MPKERMRRVNEAVREVLSMAITSDLKDPRVGFVTVTAVDTSPDLRHARVYVSVLGDERAARGVARRADLRRAATCRRGSARELRMKHTPQLGFALRRDRRARACASPSCCARRATDAMKLDIASAREEVVQELRLGEKFLLTTHENPDGDALGSLVAMNEILTQLGKDTVMFMSLEEYPLPYEYQDLPLEGVVHELPADADERTIVFLDCGNIDRMPVSFLRRDDAHIVNIDHHHDNTNFGTANLVVDGASCTAEIVYDLSAGPGRRDHADDRGRALRRARDRHRQVPVREHDAGRRTAWRPS